MNECKYGCKQKKLKCVCKKKEWINGRNKKKMCLWRKKKRQKRCLRKERKNEWNYVSERKGSHIELIQFGRVHLWDLINSKLLKGSIDDRLWQEVIIWATWDGFLLDVISVQNEEKKLNIFGYHGGFTVSFHPINVQYSCCLS